MNMTRTRDRAATERAIIDAAKEMLAREGFQNFGVNALAREAGCDKQLIYRYFDGLDGVIDAIGEDLATWSRDRLRPLLALGAPASYAELIERLALGLLQALRDDPLVQRIKAWEFGAPSPQLARLAAARSRGLVDWVNEARSDLETPPDVDAPAINAAIIGSIEAIVLSAAGAGQAYGVPLRNEEEWERIRRALKTLIRAVYA